MKVCIVGNSHVWALRAAWPECDGDLKASGIAEIVFWGVPGPKFSDVRYEGGRLVTPDSEFALRLSGGRHETVDPAEFDAVVFHGAVVNMTNLLRTLVRDRNDILSFSAALLRDVIGEQLDKAPACRLIRKIHAAYGGRILVSPPPLIAEQSRYFGDQVGKPGERAMIDGALRDYLAQAGAGYVPQPAVTVTNERYTAARYNDDTRRRDGAVEYRHMNKLYGAEVLRAIAGKLRTGAD